MFFAHLRTLVIVLAMPLGEVLVGGYFRQAPIVQLTKIIMRCIYYGLHHRSHFFVLLSSAFLESDVSYLALETPPEEHDVSKYEQYVP